MKKPEAGKPSPAQGTKNFPSTRGKSFKAVEKFQSQKNEGRHDKTEQQQSSLTTQVKKGPQNRVSKSKKIKMKNKGINSQEEEEEETSKRVKEKIGNSIKNQLEKSTKKKSKNKNLTRIEKPSPKKKSKISDGPKAASKKRKPTKPSAEPRPFECQVCGSSWTRNSHLIIHMRAHTGERPFSCSYCPISFKNKSGLYRHEKSHQGDRPHQCPHCPKKFTTPTFLRDHISECHTELKLHDCPECSEKFCTARQLKYHSITTHGERKFPCTLCDTKFMLQGHLREHLFGVHKIMPFSCSKCDQEFRLKRELSYHQATHRGDADDDSGAGQPSTAKQTVKVTRSQSLAKSKKNDQKVKSLVPAAKLKGRQEKENSSSKLIKQNKSSKIGGIEKRQVEPEEEEDSILCQNKDESSSKKKNFHCSCGKSYKGIEKFKRHKQRNEGHHDKTEIVQQSSPITEIEKGSKEKMSKSKKSKVKKGQVNKIRENEESSEDLIGDERMKCAEEEEESLIMHQVEEYIKNSVKSQVGKSAKKRKRMEIIKTNIKPNNPSTIPESPQKKKRKMLELSPDDEGDEVAETEMCDKSLKKKFHCICGKSYKSIEKFQRHEKRNGHANDEIELQLNNTVNAVNMKGKKNQERET